MAKKKQNKKVHTLRLKGPVRPNLIFYSFIPLHFLDGGCGDVAILEFLDMDSNVKDVQKVKST